MSSILQIDGYNVFSANDIRKVPKIMKCPLQYECINDSFGLIISIPHHNHFPAALDFCTSLKPLFCCQRTPVSVAKDVQPPLPASRRTVALSSAWKPIAGLPPTSLLTYAVKPSVPYRWKVFDAEYPTLCHNLHQRWRLSSTEKFATLCTKWS